MDDHGAGHIHSEPTDLQHNGAVTFTEISNDARIEAHNKLTARQNNLDTTSQQKDLTNDRTPKASAASLPPASMPARSSHTPDRPVIQSLSVATSRSPSGGPMTPMNSTVAVRSGDGAASSNTTPFVTIEPSSPVINQAEARSIGPPSSLSTISEGPSQSNRELHLDRRASRRRSGIEPLPNHRLSGFFSNLLHLRERDNGPSPVGQTTRASAPPRPPSPPSRVSVGIRTALPVEPRPPALPAPTLNELGLSLSVLTRDLSPHLFTAPTSGTFLSPHYLLLCHSQGLDVCPLVSPPAIQPYALVRRVAFKSVVVMEERGVLVAIAGRRDGVRVYALEEIRKAVEWRIEVELRRELEKHRREEVKKSPVNSKPSTPEKTKYRKKNASVDSLAASAKTTTSSTSPGKKRSRSKSNAPPPPPPVPLLPPSFPPPRLIPRTSVANLHIHRQANSRARAMSAAEAMGPQIIHAEGIEERRDDEKGDWVDVRHSDDEVLVAAGPSGSAALDERTSAISAAAAAAAVAAASVSPQPTDPSSPLNGAASRNSSRRRRPSNLDLSNVNEHGQRPVPTSPAPTLMTIRQALTQSPRTAETRLSDPDLDNEPGTPNGEVISFAEALLESRLPDAPPLGQASPHPARAAVVTRFPLSSRNPASQGSISTPPSSFMDQVLRNNQSTGAISGLVDAEGSDQEGETDGDAIDSRAPSRSGGSVRAIERRNRWSVFDGVFRPSATNHGSARAVSDAREENGSGSGAPLTRTMSDARTREFTDSRSSGHRNTLSQPTTNTNPSNTYHQRGSSGFSKIFNFPKRPRRRDRASSTATNTTDHPPIPAIITSPDSKNPDSKSPFSGFTSSSSLPPLAPPPKLEYVKLPGTKGAVMVKAVETARKSFLAILCGDAGEKVELFAGTFRTALGLSRTFILPDSPKTLELQLQGDDLVEVFLVFSQNVFGLEPATVRVREVRIGRAERRAARRRAARENNRLLLEDTPAELYGPVAEEDVALPSIIGHSENGHDQGVNSAGQNPNRRAPAGDEQRSNTLTLQTGNSGPPSAATPGFPPETGSLTPLGPPTTPHPDEVATATLIAMGPYTTFQQLSFAPPFPLAALAEECIIPPTYTTVEDHKKRFETPEESEENESSQAEETQPHEIQWYYKDPRGIVRGPWVPSLMQSWFKDGFLPPDLPVRRGTETQYIPLKELQRQSIDPESPFRPPPPGLAIPRLMVGPLRPDGVNPLLDPISLLTQEKRLGPPALFYSSRGGHSTSIVDARGRSVLKGRLHWTPDDATPQTIFSPARLGDIKRLEAFEMAHGKTVLVAFRQGGLEATDIGDAVTTPGDGCRTVYPYFEPSPSLCNRRHVFTWRTGESVTERDIDDSQSTFPSSSAIPVSTVGSGVTQPKRRSGHVSQLSGVKAPNWKGGTFSDGEEDNGFFGVQEDLLVLGRSHDKVYFCDRSTGKFRLMMLSADPNQSNPTSNPTPQQTS